MRNTAELNSQIAEATSKMKQVATVSGVQKRELQAQVTEIVSALVSAVCKMSAVVEQSNDADDLKQYLEIIGDIYVLKSMEHLPFGTRVLLDLV